MRGVFAVLVASLAVLCVLYVLVSEDRDRPSGSGLTQREKTSDAGDRSGRSLDAPTPTTIGLFQHA